MMALGFGDSDSSAAADGVENGVRQLEQIALGPNMRREKAAARNAEKPRMLHARSVHDRPPIVHALVQPRGPPDPTSRCPACRTSPLGRSSLKRGSQLFAFGSSHQCSTFVKSGGTKTRLGDLRRMIDRRCEHRRSWRTGCPPALTPPLAFPVGLQSYQHV
jgi:hypothetical protein